MVKPIVILKRAQKKSSSLPPIGNFPASYYTGPLGVNNILPTKQGALLILWPGEPGGPTTWVQFQNRVALRTSQWGRKPDGIMTTGSDGSTLINALIWIRDYGSIPIVAGINWGAHSGVLSGSQNGAIDTVAQQLKGLNVPVMVRLHHEFNYAHLSYTSIGQETAFIASWKYIVDRFHQTNGATNVGFWFCPAEGGDGTARVSANTCFAGLSPSYIDWVGSDQYNHCYVTETGCYSTPWSGGYADFGPLFDYAAGGGIAPRHDTWGPTKPFVIGETGTVADPSYPTRKAQWLNSVVPAAKNMEYLTGVAFFDIDASYWEDARNNWILDHPTSVPEVRQAMITMAQDLWFNTRS